MLAALFRCNLLCSLAVGDVGFATSKDLATGVYNLSGFMAQGSHALNPKP